MAKAVAHHRPQGSHVSLAIGWVHAGPLAPVGSGQGLVQWSRGFLQICLQAEQDSVLSGESILVRLGNPCVTALDSFGRGWHLGDDRS